MLQRKPSPSSHDPSALLPKGQPTGPGKRTLSGNEDGTENGAEAATTTGVGKGAVAAQQSIDDWNPESLIGALGMAFSDERAGDDGEFDGGEGAPPQSGGSPLPEAIRARMEQKLGADFSKVQIHTDEAADRWCRKVNAPACTVGTHIYFRAGVGPHHEEILTHELVHVIQNGDQSAGGATTLGGRDDSAEHEADKATAAVQGGEEAPQISRGHAPSTVRRFGAGFHADGHGSIEKEAAGASGESQGLKEMYSGNFMRDMNQLNVPKVIDGLKSLPKDVASPLGAQIGGKGAMEITTAVIKAMAILELGPKVADKLINQGAIGAYRPEEHIDNPMGTGAADTIVTNTDPTRVANPNEKKKKKVPLEVGEPRTADGTVATKMVDKTDTAADRVKAAIGLGDKVEVLDPQGSGKDADRDRELKGSAFSGNQVENPKLYEVSPSGMANHIYNSNESVKARWLKAAQLGASPRGRSEFGAGLHAVEDYFSHSNFVEVALNGYIEQALSFKNKNAASRAFADKVVANNKASFGAATVGDQHYYVDTLYDAKTDPKNKSKVGGAKPRQAITTGSFGGDDTKVSIAHVLLPSLPKLQDAMLKTVDRAFGIAATAGDSGWAQIKTMLAGTPEGSAGVTLLEGFDSAGMVAPVPDLQLKWKTIPITPGLIGDPVTVTIPYGIDHISKSVPVSEAFSTYAAIYKKAKDLQALIKEYAGYAKKLLIPLEPLIAAIDEEIKKIEQEVRKSIKAQVTAGLVSVVDSISGRTEKEKQKQKAQRGPIDPKDPDAEFKKDLGDSLDYLHDSVESIEEQTSIDVRLKNGDLSQMPKAKVEALVGPVTSVTEETLDQDGKKVVRTYYKSVNPLPPSHSEIAKDHGPHEEVDHHHDHDEEGPGNEAGSPFFSVARPLAVEAVRHCDAQMQVVWASRSGGGDTSLFGDGKTYEFQSGLGGNSKALHAGLLGEADANAAAESKRAKDEGHRYLQDSRADEIKAIPGTDRLLNLVDLFISHPENNTWWKAILDQQVATNPEPIYQSILRRNATRSKRKL